MDHLPIIVIVSGYTGARKSSLENDDYREWVPISLCDKPKFYSLKESVSDIRYLIVI